MKYVLVVRGGSGPHRCDLQVTVSRSSTDCVVGALPGKPYGTRVGTDSPCRLRQPWQGGARRVPASPGAACRGEEVEGA